ncbi:MAG: FAD:protein FMN transferase, partial [Planctomycetota bacterium]
NLANEVLSCSGIGQGSHIINPATGQPITDRTGCWVRLKESAALADALSTAGMIMATEDIESMSKELLDSGIMLITADGTQQPFDNWNTD